MIRLSVNNQEYEYDIRVMLMAFFYGEKISTEDVPAEKVLSVELSDEGSGFSVSAVFVSGDRVFRRTGNTAAHAKNERSMTLKKLLYDLLGEAAGKRLPWGVLTGVRPAKIASKCLQEGMGREETERYLRDMYFVSPEKARLCTDVAEQETEILSELPFADTYSLYAGVPFCPSICAYCSFSSYPISQWKGRAEDYLDAFEREVTAAAALFPLKKILTLYVGGGTPTSLSAPHLDRFLGILEDSFDLSAAREKTVEAGRPDSITPEKLRVLKKHGIDRISVNPQTMNQETLDLIGRRHTVQDVRDAFHMARDAGFAHINMDVIAGLPGETARHMEITIREIEKLAPDSLTVHCLALKRAAFLNQNREKFPVAEAREINRMIRISREGADRMGMKPYYLYRQKNIAGNLENVGYATPGSYGLYNMLIMEERQTILAVGSGATSKFLLKGNADGPLIERVENVKSVKDYIERTDEMIRRKKDFCNSHKTVLL